MVAPPFGPGLSDTRRSLLLALKRHGPASLAEMVSTLRYAPATLREHLQALVALGVVERRGTRRGPRRRGRPEVVYGLSGAGEDLFPHREGALLAELAAFLAGEGDGGVLVRFLRARNEARLPAALARLRGLEGRARLAEVARILSEEGYMAECVPHRPTGRPQLRLCHCPIRDLLPASRQVCAAEIAFVQALVGRPLARTAYMPDGDGACAYAPAGLVQDIPSGRPPLRPRPPRGSAPGSRSVPGASG